MTIPVFRLPPGDQWDQALLDDILAGHIWPTGYTFEEIEWLDPDVYDGAVVIVPARYHATKARRLERLLAGLRWVVLLLTSDEESLFPPHAIRHPNMRVWTMTPRPEVHGGRGDTRWLGEGIPAGTADKLATIGFVPKSGWWFAGQVNHPGREACVAALADVPDGELVTTPGFTQGLTRFEYITRLAAAKVAPAPSGPATPDSFRCYEALEAGCVPIVAASAPAGSHGYWPFVWGPVPFPVLEDWADAPTVIAEQLAAWPANANRCSSWWQQRKRDLALRLADDVAATSGIAPRREPVTVLVPTSPIPTHPSTAFIEETVGSIRHHLPDAEIIVMCDGVRAEQEDRRDAYEAYLRRLVWLCEHQWRNVVPIVHDEHLHQADMTRHALELVRTEAVLFVEHDTPLVCDETIDWPEVFSAVRDQLDVVRFHHEAVILEPHRYLMLDETPLDVGWLPVLRTIQWSQRPHVASTAYYRRILAEHFRPGARTMIEDKMHSVAQCDPQDHRLAIYAPGDNLKRSLHLDGRGADVKYDMDPT